MKNNTHIIVLGVGESIDRTTLERIQGETFNSPDHARKEIDPEGKAEIGVYSLSEFMDACNNTDSDAEEELAINIAKCWIGYVEIEEAEDEPKYILTDNEKIHVVGSHGVSLSSKIQEEDLHEYSIAHRESLIEDLYRWIAEGSNQAQMMKDDLRMLEDLEDDYIFSSNSTNSYISSESPEFNQTCEELIEINENL